MTRKEPRSFPDLVESYARMVRAQKQNQDKLASGEWTEQDVIREATLHATRRSQVVGHAVDGQPVYVGVAPGKARLNGQIMEWQDWLAERKDYYLSTLSSDLHDSPHLAHVLTYELAQERRRRMMMSALLSPVELDKLMSGYREDAEKLDALLARMFAKSKGDAHQ